MHVDIAAAQSKSYIKLIPRRDNFLHLWENELTINFGKGRAPVTWDRLYSLVMILHKYMFLCPQLKLRGIDWRRDGQATKFA